LALTGEAIELFLLFQIANAAFSTVRRQPVPLEMAANRKLPRPERAGQNIENIPQQLEPTVLWFVFAARLNRPRDKDLSQRKPQDLCSLFARRYSLAGVPYSLPPVTKISSALPRSTR
jgi:hypothetical protein